MKTILSTIYGISVRFLIVLGIVLPVLSLLVTAIATIPAMRSLDMFVFFQLTVVACTILYLGGVILGGLIFGVVAIIISLPSCLKESLSPPSLSPRPCCGCYYVYREGQEYPDIVFVD
jgi:hypothetical protein